jgi:putative hydrolases of HD superfamily
MTDPGTARLGQQLRFAVEADRLKGVERRTLLTDGSRRENAAEHSWHLALMALLLAEHASAPLDLRRVLEMLLVHDLVEIDAGDTYSYDPTAQEGKEERELAAAQRLFALLPDEQAELLLERWREHERGETPEGRFAQALDRLQPVLQNFHSGGVSWREHRVGRRQVERRVAAIGEIAPALGRHVEALLAEAARRGWLSDDS